MNKINFNPKYHNEFAKKWILALLSGRYEQGGGALCLIVDGVEKYCCLGVAEDLNMTEYSIVDSKKCYGPFNNTHLTLKTMNSLELLDTGGEPIDPSYDYLTHLNDSEYSFNDIAKLLIKHPSRYFREIK